LTSCPLPNLNFYNRSVKNAVACGQAAKSI